METKLFFIGFNKTATTAFHRLFLDSGYLSYHHNIDGKSLALGIEDNLREGRPVLQGFADANVYSDLTYSSHTQYIEANGYFRELHAEYPDAYFVLQTRNEDDWISSRFRHPHFVSRTCGLLGLTEDDLEHYWRDQLRNHLREVRDYFGSSPARFLEIDIDADEIDALIAFAKPDFRLARAHWRKHNETQTSEAIGGPGRSELIDPGS
jgi:hypothetical protein